MHISQKSLTTQIVIGEFWSRFDIRCGAHAQLLRGCKRSVECRARYWYFGGWRLARVASKRIPAPYFLFPEHQPCV